MALCQVQALRYSEVLSCIARTMNSFVFLPWRKHNKSGPMWVLGKRNYTDYLVILVLWKIDPTALCWMPTVTLFGGLVIKKARELWVIGWWHVSSFFPFTNNRSIPTTSIVDLGLGGHPMKAVFENWSTPINVSVQARPSTSALLQAPCSDSMSFLLL